MNVGSEGPRGAALRPLRLAAAIGGVVALAALALFAPKASVAQARQGAKPERGYQLNDCHLHLTNYIQEGIDIHSFLRSMGTSVGRVAVFGIPLQQQWSFRVSGDYAPTYYLQTDAPLYYYSFTDAHIAMEYRSLQRRRAGALRSDDHRVQPDRYVRRGSYSSRAADVPRRLLGDRRVLHPQGVRFGEGCGRGRQPAGPGPRPAGRLRGRGGAGGPDPQRHRRPLPEAGRQAGLPRPDGGVLQAAPEGDDHLGAHGRRPRDPSHRRPRRDDRTT